MILGNSAVNRTVKILKNHGVIVMPTDTIYGLVGSAFSENAIERIYELKNRDTKKPLIILISEIKDLKKFGIILDKKLEQKIAEFWPGPTSIIFKCKKERFRYLHRGINSLTFRLPKDFWLIEFLKQTGPLVAPSANPEGLPPAKNITEAKKYFNGLVDYYLDGGELNNPPSKLIKIVGDKIEILR